MNPSTCNPPNMAGLVGFGVFVGGLVVACLTAATVGMFVSTSTRRTNPKQAFGIGAAAAVVSTVAVVGLCLLWLVAANADYDRCEQRARVTVGGAR